jgi:hypothetical protein
VAAVQQSNQRKGSHFPLRAIIFFKQPSVQSEPSHQQSEGRRKKEGRSKPISDHRIDQKKEP